MLAFFSLLFLSNPFSVLYSTAGFFFFNVLSKNIKENGEVFTGPQWHVRFHPLWWKGVPTTTAGMRWPAWEHQGLGRGGGLLSGSVWGAREGRRRTERRLWGLCQPDFRDWIWKRYCRRKRNGQFSVRFSKLPWFRAKWQCNKALGKRHLISLEWVDGAANSTVREHRESWPLAAGGGGGVVLGDPLPLKLRRSAHGWSHNSGHHEVLPSSIWWLDSQNEVTQQKPREGVVTHKRMPRVFPEITEEQSKASDVLKSPTLPKICVLILMWTCLYPWLSGSGIYTNTYYVLSGVQP